MLFLLRNYNNLAKMDIIKSKWFYLASSLTSLLPNSIMLFKQEFGSVVLIRCQFELNWNHLSSPVFGIILFIISTGGFYGLQWDSRVMNRSSGIIQARLVSIVHLYKKQNYAKLLDTIKMSFPNLHIEQILHFRDGIGPGLRDIQKMVEVLESYFLPPEHIAYIALLIIDSAKRVSTMKGYTSAKLIELLDFIANFNKERRFSLFPYYSYDKLHHAIVGGDKTACTTETLRSLVQFAARIRKLVIALSSGDLTGVEMESTIEEAKTILSVNATKFHHYDLSNCKLMLEPKEELKVVYEHIKAFVENNSDNILSAIFHQISPFSLKWKFLSKFVARLIYLKKLHLINSTSFTSDIEVSNDGNEVPSAGKDSAKLWTDLLQQLLRSSQTQIENCSYLEFVGIYFETKCCESEEVMKDYFLHAQAKYLFNGPPLKELLLLKTLWLPRLSSLAQEGSVLFSFLEKFCVEACVSEYLLKGTTAYPIENSFFLIGEQHLLTLFCMNYKKEFIAFYEATCKQCSTTSTTNEITEMKERFLCCFPEGLAVLQEQLAVEFHKKNKPDDMDELVERIEKEYHYCGQPFILKRVLSELNGLVKSSTRPPVFLFMGPTGVGKTELAKVIAKVHCEDRLIRLDMNNYTTSMSVSNLFGADSGLVGNDVPGKLVSEYRRIILSGKSSNETTEDETLEKKSAVILLDEFEKAHQSVKDSFLAMFDEGYFQAINPKRAEETDITGKLPSEQYAKGGQEEFDVHNCVIILTSNLYQKQIKEFLSQEDVNNGDYHEALIEEIEKLNDRFGKLPAELIGRTVLLGFGYYTSAELVKVFQQIVLKEMVSFQHEYKLDSFCCDDEALLCWSKWMIATANSPAGLLKLQMQLRKVRNYFKVHVANQIKSKVQISQLEDKKLFLKFEIPSIETQVMKTSAAAGAVIGGALPDEEEVVIEQEAAVKCDVIDGKQLFLEITVFEFAWSVPNKL